MRKNSINRFFYRAAMGAVSGLFLYAAASAQAPLPQSTLPLLQSTIQPRAAEADPFEGMFYTMPPAAAAPAADGGSPAADGLAPKIEAEEPAAKDQHGQIRIHGHWVIEVKRKDGTVRDRREFENSYVGGYIMGLYLAGFDTPVDPAISIFSSANGPGSLCNGLQNVGAAVYNSCTIFSSVTAGHGAVDTAIGYCALPGSCYSGLTTSLTSNGSGGYTGWVLTATIAPITSGTFDTVATSLTGCYNSGYNSAATVSPSSCITNAVSYLNNSYPTPLTPPYLANNAFTQTVLPGGAVTVTAGETLVFTVTISFS